LAQGRGKSKKEAEVRAAIEALRKKVWLTAEAS
jgi:dsRNA-specific ribonuclease